MSVSNTCMHYSKQALAPIVSLVTLLLSSVMRLGSRAKSPTGKGTKSEDFVSSTCICRLLFFHSWFTSFHDSEWDSHWPFPSWSPSHQPSHHHSLFCTSQSLFFFYIHNLLWLSIASHRSPFSTGLGNFSVVGSLLPHPPIMTVSLWLFVFVHYRSTYFD